ncbi:MAG TPA: ferrochelatase, partial [Myxococcales bacterium]|nr:ferrochelatase [Myxococcales bacterium]
PRRARKRAQAYRQIWQKEGSPLIVYSEQLAQSLQEYMGESFIVATGMCFGNPSVSSALHKLLALKPHRLIVVPLFPQYSSAASGGALETTLKSLQKSEVFPQMNFVAQYFDHPQYIQTLSTHIATYMHAFQPDMLLLSYHGLPITQVKKSCSKAAAGTCPPSAACPHIDPSNQHCYPAQCYATSALLGQELKLSDEQYRICFQSRLGRQAWLQPYMEPMLDQLYREGKRRVMIACPGFSIDCLETLEEIGLRARNYWLQLGGEDLQCIPCLNAKTDWVRALAQIAIEASTPETTEMPHATNTQDAA